MSRVPAPARRLSAIRVVAGFEAVKGVFVLVAGTGLLSLLHRDANAIAASLLEHAHLNPAAKYPHILLDAVSHLDDGRLLMLAAGAIAYAAFRLVEAWGLYRERPWAELLAACSGAIYVPFELLGLLRKPSWHGALLLVVNLAIVGLMVRAFRRRRLAA